MKKIRRFVKFAIFCCIPWWLTAPVSSAAPKNGRLLINSFLEYQEKDQVIASAALKSFERHLWYLTEELVPLSLFCSSVENSTKQAIAQKMLTIKNDAVCAKRFGCGFGKPKFPSLPTNPVTNLDIFIGEDSWSFFHILQLDSSFLCQSVGSWNKNETYLNAKLIVENIRVVNDAAERGVKLAQDFNDAAHNEKHYQNILQTVENSRNTVPNQRNCNQAGSSWHFSMQ